MFYQGTQRDNYDNYLAFPSILNTLVNGLLRFPALVIFYA